MSFNNNKRKNSNMLVHRASTHNMSKESPLQPQQIDGIILEADEDTGSVSDGDSSQEK